MRIAPDVSFIASFVASNATKEAKNQVPPSIMGAFKVVDG
jgi:hypothetical protein